MVSCLVNGACISLAIEDCFEIDGQPVKSCTVSSSSTTLRSSSSSAVLSSSSRISSSSSKAISSSSSKASSSSAKLSSSSSVLRSSSSSIQSSSSSSSTISSSGGNTGDGVQFNEDPQIYNKDGSRFNGNGVIKWYIYESSHGNDDNDTTINIGSVMNGIVKLELPVYPEKYPYRDGWLQNCKISPENTILSYDDEYTLFDSNEEYLGKLILGYSDNGNWHIVSLLYSPKNAKVNCDNNIGGIKGNIDVKAGWNKLYVKVPSCDDNGELCEGGIVSTNNFFTKEAKWTKPK